MFLHKYKRHRPKKKKVIRIEDKEKTVVLLLNPKQ